MRATFGNILKHLLPDLENDECSEEVKLKVKFLLTFVEGGKLDGPLFKFKYTATFNCVAASVHAYPPVSFSALFKEDTKVDHSCKWFAYGDDTKENKSIKGDLNRANQHIGLYHVPEKSFKDSELKNRVKKWLALEVEDAGEDGSNACCKAAKARAKDIVKCMLCYEQVKCPECHPGTCKARKGSKPEQETIPNLNKLLVFEGGDASGFKLEELLDGLAFGNEIEDSEMAISYGESSEAPSEQNDQDMKDW